MAAAVSNPSRVLVQTRDLALFEHLQRQLRSTGLRIEALGREGTLDCGQPVVTLVDLRGAAQPTVRLRSVDQRVPGGVLVALVRSDDELFIDDPGLARAVASTLAAPFERAALFEVLESALRLASRRTKKRLRAVSLGGCILVIEDDEDHAALTRRLLRRIGRGQAVRSVGSVEAALDELREQKVQLVLADLSLPDAQGLDVIRRLRAHSPAVPIIVLSAMLDDALALEVLRAGAEDCLPKDGLDAGRLRHALEFAAERGERIGVLAARARSDALTHLTNRAAFEQRLEQALSRGRRLGSKVAVLFLDLDGFKGINDRLGHLAGDRLLCEVAHRLRTLVRQQDVIGRLGGDEFALLVEDVTDRAGLERLAERALRVLGRPMAVAGEVLRPRCSMGIALFPQHAKQVDELLHASDEAMYDAKRSGGGRYVYAGRNSSLPLRARRARTLTGAVIRRSLCVFYQPQVRLQSGRVTGVEALLRCTDASGDRVTAHEAVPVLERAGLMPDVGRWLLASASRQLTELQRAAGESLTLCVNLSASELSERDLPSWFESSLRASGHAPQDVEVEVRDAFRLLQQPALRERLLGLRALGARIALDGAGCADALRALCQLPCDTLKLDVALTRSLCADDRAQVVARHIVQMAHDLGLRVVAVGVENEQEGAVLADCGCDDAQGYLFGAPADVWQANWGGKHLGSIA